MYPFLGKVLPNVDVFLCPFAPPPSVTIQAQYEDYTNLELIPEGTHGSYNYFWGGYTFTRKVPGPFPSYGSISGKEFDGPRNMAARGAKLLLCDVMSFWSGDIWFLSHPGKEAVEWISYDPSYSNFVSANWVRRAWAGDIPLGLKMNAGFVDGHVEPYWSEQTERFLHFTPSGTPYAHEFYVPLNWYR